MKDGSRLPVIISSRGFEDPDGLMFVVVTFTDISEQKQAEAELRHANAKLEQRQNEIEEDLLLAARVQQSLAPQSLVWGGMRVEAYFHPVRTIGGDFGLVSPLDDRHLNLLVCDVSGHGIGSALVANRIYSETMAQLRSGAPLSEMLRQLNRFVMHNLGSSALLFTLAAARIDIGGRRMIFAGAGHPPAMIVTPGEEPRLLESRSMVLGGLADAVAVEAALEVDLNPGDRVVLYTDGISEVFDSSGEMLGTAGVQKFVRETALLPFGEMKQALLEPRRSLARRPAHRRHVSGPARSALSADSADARHAGDRAKALNRVHFCRFESFMDPVTHGIAGALLGKGFFSKRQERVAIFAATLGAVFPDIDIFAEAILARSAEHRKIPSRDHAFVRRPAIFCIPSGHSDARALSVGQATMAALSGSGIAAAGNVDADLRRWHRQPHRPRRHDIIRHAHVVSDFEPARRLGPALHHRLQLHLDHSGAAGDRVDLSRSGKKPRARACACGCSSPWARCWCGC